jgi:hypothetical protein
MARALVTEYEVYEDTERSAALDAYRFGRGLGDTSDSVGLNQLANRR